MNEIEKVEKRSKEIVELFERHGFTMWTDEKSRLRIHLYNHVPNLDQRTNSDIAREYILSRLLFSEESSC